MIDITNVINVINVIIDIIAPWLRMSGQHFSIIIVAIVLFFLLFIDFGIILKNFTAFSPWVAWVLAFCICVVAAVSGILNSIVVFLVTPFGYIGATLILIGLKGGSTILELLIAQKLKSQKEKKKKFEEKIGKESVQAIGKALIKKIK